MKLRLHLEDNKNGKVIDTTIFGISVLKKEKQVLKDLENLNYVFKTPLGLFCSDNFDVVSLLQDDSHIKNFSEQEVITPKSNSKIISMQYSNDSSIFSSNKYPSLDFFKHGKSGNVMVFESDFENRLNIKEQILQSISHYYSSNEERIDSIIFLKEDFILLCNELKKDIKQNYGLPNPNSIMEFFLNTEYGKITILNSEKINANDCFP